MPTMTHEEARLRSAKDGPYRVTRIASVGASPFLRDGLYSVSAAGGEVLCTMTHKETAELFAAAPDIARELIEMRSKVRQLEESLDEARRQLRDSEEEGSKLRIKIPVDGHGLL